MYDMLHRISSYYDGGTAYSAAAVCKAWYEPAMDILWEEVDYSIFRQLGDTCLTLYGVLCIPVRLRSASIV